MLVVVIAAFFFNACNKKSNSSDTSVSYDNFKTNMLVNYADTLLIPGYTDFLAKMTVLENAANSFLNAPSVAAQDSLRPVFKNAYLSFERVSMPFFGPASSISANRYINSFPTSAPAIETGIQSGVYDFTVPGTSDTIQGLPALDYLLFSANAVTRFSASDAANRKRYVRDIITRIKQLSQSTLTQWNGGYRAVFISSLKTDVGSSIGLIVNQFASEMDAMKGPRIGWPFGKQSNGTVFADKCEAYYTGFSAAVAVQNLESLKNYYTGGTGSGMDDYLILLKKNQLNTDVLAQFDVAINALKALPDPLSAAFTNNATLVDEAYRQVQKLLTLLKTDVASAIGVQINYMDNDGD